MIDKNYADAIKSFEGFTARSVWDYAQASNGYGTKAKYLGEVIDQAEAEKRFKSEIAGAQALVEQFAPHLDDGSKAALTSLTYNAGTAWMKSGLGQAVGAGDLDSAQKIFLTYNKAGGEVLPGLVKRRLAEVTWFGQSSGSLSACGLVDHVSVAAAAHASPALLQANNVSPSRHHADAATAFAGEPAGGGELMTAVQSSRLQSADAAQDILVSSATASCQAGRSTATVLTLLDLLTSFALDPRTNERRSEESHSDRRGASA